MYWEKSFYSVALFLVILGCSTDGTLSTIGSDRRTKDVEKAQYYVSQGNECAKKRDFYNAKQNFLKAAALDPTDYQIWGLAGQAAQANSEFNEAVRYFQKTIELNPTDYRAYGHIGVIKKRLKEYDNAISAFKSALALNNTDLESISNLAEIYYQTSDYRQCEEHMARFEESLSKKNINLLSDQTKKAIEGTLNRFANYRAKIKENSEHRTDKSL